MKTQNTVSNEEADSILGGKSKPMKNKIEKLNFEGLTPFGISRVLEIKINELIQSHNDSLEGKEERNTLTDMSLEDAVKNPNIQTISTPDLISRKEVIKMIDKEIDYEFSGDWDNGYTEGLRWLKSQLKNLK